MLREAQNKRAVGKQEPVRILLVEDDAISAEILLTQLRSVQSLRSRLEVAGRLSDALLKLASEPFALVLADLNLPDSTGADTVAALAQASGSPIIVLTGDSTPDLRARCLELGAYDFIAKGQLTAAALDRALRLAAIQARAQHVLQTAQARLSHLLQLSTDWHWEQDEHFCYTRFEGRVDELLGSDSRSAIGRARWEIPTNEPAAGSWDDHRAVLEAHRPFRNFETRRRGDDGKIHHVVANGDPIFDHAGRFLGYRGVASDITVRKRAEAALRESEARFRSLTALSSDWYWEQDGEFRLTYMSSIEKTGLDASAYLGLKRWQQPALNLTAADWERHRAQLEAHQPFRDFEMERPAEDGLSVWLSVSGEPVFDAQGTFIGYRGIGRDITSRKRSEAKISHLHRMYAALGAANEAVLRARSAQEVFERACGIAVDAGGFLLGVVYILDERSGGLVRAAASGLAASAIEEKPPSLDEAQSDHGLVAHAWRSGTAAISNDYAHDPRSAARRGVARPYTVGSAAVFPLRVDGAQAGVLGLQHAQRDAFADELTALLQRLADNISFALENFGREARRLQAERESRETEARFRSLTSLSSDTYWEQDASYRFTKFTDTASDRLRTRRDDRLGKHRWDHPYFNMSEASWAAHRADLDARRAFRDLELGRVNDAGELVWVSVSGEPVFDESGAFNGYRGVGKDITPRKREEALQRLEHEATRVLAAAASPAEGVQAVLRALSASEGWKCARFFQLDESAGVMRFDEAASFHPPGFETLIERSRGLAFTTGEGLIGEVWRSGKPLWVADTSRDPRVKRALAQEPRLRSALVFPVLAEGAVVGVASMSNDRIREPDGRLQKTMELIGSLLGQFLQRKQAEAALQQSEAWFRQTFELAGSGMAHVALDGTFIRVNRRLCKILGYEAGELIGQSVKQISHPDDRDASDAQRARLRTDDVDSVQLEKRYRRRDGSTLWVDLTVALARDTQGTPLYEISILEDITHRKRAEERQAMHLRYQERVARFGQLALSKSEPAELMEKAVQAVLEALDAEAVSYIETDPSRREVMLRALVGVADAGAKPGPIACAAGDAIVSVLTSGARLLTDGTQLPMRWARELGSVALIPVRSDGTIRGVLCACYRRAGAFGAEELNFVEAIASVLSAALQRIDSEGRLAYLAQFDPLTGLPNRTLLADRFSQMIVQAKRRATTLAVLFIDLDEFKMVNDTLGHAGGDALLKEVAVRLQSTVRSGDTVGRISGDEFAVVLGDLARAEDAALVAQKIIDRLAGAVEVHGKEVFVTASVGIASFPSDGADADSLIGAADAAMYRAKQSGRNAYQFFTADINQRSRARAQLGSELRRALEREEFALVYQAKYHLGNRRPNGAEALLRWKHPERGMVSPADFIPVLEETGLIVPVGEWVIRRACEDLKSWQAQGLNVGPVSVNLSARQFRLQDLDKRIVALVSAARVDPSLIELEITESHLMQDPDHAIRVMRALCGAGMRIAIDDFGTGYSSLAYLTRFPVGTLKIDRSFIKGMSSDKGHATIVRTIVEMAHTLGFTVIAEGVESEEQAISLRQLRCEYAQGFLFAKPVPAAALAKLFSAS